MNDGCFNPSIAVRREKGRDFSYLEFFQSGSKKRWEQAYPNWGYKKISDTNHNKQVVNPLS